MKDLIEELEEINNNSRKILESIFNDDIKNNNNVNSMSQKERTSKTERRSKP